MRNILIFIALLITCVVTMAQSYLPTLTDGNRWEIRKPMGMGQFLDYVYVVKCDTLIGDKLYKPAILASTSGILGYYREDTLEQKVYKWNPAAENEEAIIDYSLNAGDSMELAGYSITIDSIAYKTYMGRERKFLYFGSIQAFIEGVGHSFYGVHDFGGYQLIMSFEEAADTCSLSTEVIDTYSGGIHVYPNPTESILKITGINNRHGLLTILNYSGQVVQTEKASANVNIAHLAPGIYFLKIEGAPQTYKVIKL